MRQTCSKTLVAQGLDRSKDQKGSHDSVEDDEPVEKQEYRGPGRPSGSFTAEEYWTRVLSPCYHQIDYQQKFNITMDLANELEVHEKHEGFEDNISWPIFLPDEWAKEYGMLKKEDWELKEEQLKEWAVEITALRMEIMKKAILKEGPNLDPRQKSEIDELKPQMPL